MAEKRREGSSLEQTDAFLRETRNQTLEELTRELGAGSQRVEWLAAGLGLSASALKRVQAGPLAGEDAGALFCILDLEGVHLAFREDGLRAYVRNNTAARKLKAEVLSALLSQRGVQAVDVEALAQLPNKPPGAWVRAAEGQEPIRSLPEQVEYLLGNQPVATEALRQSAEELHRVLEAPTIEREALLGVRASAVVPGQVVGRLVKAQPGQPGRDVFGRQLLSTEVPPLPLPAAGLHVDLADAGEYLAERYGYFCLVENQPTVLLPLWMSPDLMQVYWVQIDPNPQTVTAAMIGQCLADLGVVEGVLQEEIASLAEQAQHGAQPPGYYLIAQGTPAVHGEDAVVEMLVDPQQQLGREREDGSIDFSEENFAPDVRVGQLVARRILPRPGVPGKDVRGGTVPAVEGKDRSLRVGKNVGVEVENGVERFFAEIEGVIRVRGDEVSVAEVLVIKGDVGYKTGNLSFGGEIYIEGAVTAGFAVRAGGNITVSGLVEEGAEVAAGGDLAVGRGIQGRRTRIVAQASVRAPFVQEATVLARGDILLGNYAYHAQLRSGGEAIVNKGAGSRGGSLIGGQTWALKRIDAHLAGTLNGVSTVLVAGLDAEQAKTWTSSSAVSRSAAPIWCASWTTSACLPSM
ncbi:MAG: DUF342 domain-containing protein [Candidatus Latescibacteria bacterium]|nr:DUF342 domain-containing protein [Candidatus Latescibacterota bacterium]